MGALNDDTTMRPDGREAVLWSEGSRRCELWTVNGTAQLRVLDGAALIHQEPVVPGLGYRRALTLRHWVVHHSHQPPPGF